MTWSERQEATQSIVKLFDKFRSNCNFNDDGQLSQLKLKQFQSLFSKEATIIDIFNPIRVDDTKVEAVDRPIQEFINTIQSDYPGGLDLTLQNVSLDYSNLSTSSIAKLLVSRAYSTNLNPETLNDIIEVEVKLSPDFKSAEIVKITGGKTSLSFTFNPCPELAIGESDTDGDCVSNKDDGCPNKRGPKETNGCPDRRW